MATGAAATIVAATVIVTMTVTVTVNVTIVVIIAADPMVTMRVAITAAEAATVIMDALHLGVAVNRNDLRAVEDSLNLPQAAARSVRHRPAIVGTSRKGPIGMTTAGRWISSASRDGR